MLDQIPRDQYLATVFAARDRQARPGVHILGQSTPTESGHRIDINFEFTPGGELELADTFFGEFIHAVRDVYALYPDVPFTEEGDHEVKMRLLEQYIKEVQEYLDQHAQQNRQDQGAGNDRRNTPSPAPGYGKIDEIGGRWIQILRASPAYQ